ncbi:condensation domain-containing protein [Xanthomonas sacchari]|nr:condensation domain-containing protein [Xanthomonas sacchari]
MPLRELFAHPSLAAFAAQVHTAARAEAGTLPLADRTQPLPLSWAQQRLWFIDQLDHAAGAAYHIPAALRLSGHLDRTALQRTLDRIVERHESLRTTFTLHQGEPIQVIAPPQVGLRLAEHDLSHLDSQAQPHAVAERAAAEAAAPFDLEHDRLIRGQLLRLSPTEHVLLVTQHHIVSDGWSIGVLIQEVAALYAAFRLDQPDPLPPLALQYADYAAWQRQWLHGEVTARQLAFWKQHLEEAPAYLELPTDRPRPLVQRHAGASLPIVLPAPLVDKLQAVSRRHGVTPFMTLLAAWSLVLARLSGQHEVVVGTPVANRQRTEVEPLIGFFVNTLALRVRLDEDPTVADLLAQVRHTTLTAYEHQDLPFEQVVEALQPVRSLSHSPLFQVMLALDNTPLGQPLALPGLTLSPVEQAIGSAHFDLSLSLHTAGERMEGQLTYASDLFQPGTAQRWIGYFLRLLQAMLDAPQQTPVHSGHA